MAEFFYGAGDMSEGGPVPTVPAGGAITFELEGSVNGVTAETCHFENIGFHAIVVR